jgi:acyl carrier protein
MSISDQEIKDRAKAVLAKTMKVNPNDLKDDIAQQDISEWDSVHHMNVVVGLENEFDIEFLDSDLPTLTSIPAIVAAIQRYREK